MEMKQSVTPGTKSGTVLTFTDADTVNGNSFLNDGHTWLVLNNVTGMTAVTATIPVIAKCDDDLSVPPRTCSADAGVAVLLGPFAPNLYNDVNGNVTFTVSGAIPICLLSV
jgi:hypothetical protein